MSEVKIGYKDAYGNIFDSDGHKIGYTDAYGNTFNMDGKKVSHTDAYGNTWGEDGHIKYRTDAYGNMMKTADQYTSYESDDFDPRISDTTLYGANTGCRASSSSYDDEPSPWDAVFGIGFYLILIGLGFHLVKWFLDSTSMI